MAQEEEDCETDNQQGQECKDLGPNRGGGGCSVYHCACKDCIEVIAPIGFLSEESYESRQKDRKVAMMVHFNPSRSLKTGHPRVHSLMTKLS